MLTFQDVCEITHSPLLLRREGDSNPRYRFAVFTLSRRASSATPAPLLIFRHASNRGLQNNKKI